MCMTVLPACMYVHQCCAMPMEVREDVVIPWKWSYKLLLAAMWVLGFKAGSSARAADALNCQVISPACSGF